MQRLVTGPLPLYFPCQCRPTKGFLAQLMRIFVAVPSSPVHVQLRLRVRPGPVSAGTSVFTPPTKEPLLLPPGELWVVRLPYPLHVHVFFNYFLIREFACFSARQLRPLSRTLCTKQFTLPEAKREDWHELPEAMLN